MKNISKHLPILCVLLALFTCMSPMMAQVTGVVVDETGEPVIGASVLEKGTTNGTITDLDGNFTLPVSQGAQLEFSYVGYASQTIAAADGMRVVLKEIGRAHV